MSRYDYIVEIEKFNPYHGEDGKFTTASGSGSGGGSRFDPIDTDDDLLPWNDVGSGSTRRATETKPKNPSNDEIKAEIKRLDKNKNLQVYIHEMPDADHTIRAELIGTLPGGNEIQFHDGYKIKTAAAMQRFKEIYAESAEAIEYYHKIGYRGL